jgi:SAM-dependent methyltransferase
MPELSYAGRELDIFAYARRWKRYWSSQLRPYVQGNVLEVGAGIGANTPLLRDATRGRWLCLEPDPALASQIQGQDVRVGTLGDLGAERFDTILYIDVLEHIEDDAAELSRAMDALKPGGRVIVLSPAHQSLYSPFDASIGHFRRYDRASLSRLSPHAPERIFYLDSMGLFASAANRLFLRQSMPTLAQIQTWDRWIIPVSRVVDPVLGYQAGKTIVGIWNNP